jgi:SAM-dependent methyltransferase
MTKAPELKKYTEANRKAWNEAMPHHRAAAGEKWDMAFQQPGFGCLKENEIQQFQRIGILGRDVVHLCCNNGIELLSIKNLGAGRCLGVDISDEAIRQAQERASLSKIDCQFIRSDVYDLGEVYASQFDIVYISVGCLGWMPDLNLFFQTAAGLLRTGGYIFIHESHPFLEMLPFDGDEKDPLFIVEPYFKSEPYVDYGGLDYIGRTEYESTIPQYWFVRKLSDIMMSLLASHMVLEHFSEYETDISAGHKRLEEAKAGVPLSYILIAKK